MEGQDHAAFIVDHAYGRHTRSYQLLFGLFTLSRKEFCLRFINLVLQGFCSNFKACGLAVRAEDKTKHSVTFASLCAVASCVS